MQQPELRRDPLRDTWTIFSEERRRRPSEYHFQQSADAVFDPFAPGHEKSTPPEILALRPENSEANSPGWKWRVVPNRYPALRIEGRPEGRPDGIFDAMDGLGAHEVVIETCDSLPLEKLPVAHVASVLGAWKQRILDLTKDVRFQYICVFKNHGPLAGATLSHAHSQIVALPLVPELIRRMCTNAAQYFRWKGRHWFRDLLLHEEQVNKRVVFENSGFVVLCPYASRFLFEMAIYPRRLSANFQTCTEHDLNQLAEALQAVLLRMNLALENPAYNITLLNGPLNAVREATPEALLIRDSWCWHLEITPRLGTLAGFELGTGFHINTLLPEDAARHLREVIG